MKVLLHASRRGPQCEEPPLRRAGFSVVTLPEHLLKKNKLIKFFGLIYTAKKERPDMILIDLAGLILVCAYIVSLLFRIPLAVRVRANIWAIYEEMKTYSGFHERIYQSIIFKMDEAIYKRADRLLCVSEYLKGVLEQNGVQKEKIRVLHLFIDHQRFLPGKGKEGIIQLLSVTNFSFKLKSEAALAVLPQIDNILTRHKNVCYKIAGKGIFSGLLQKELQHLKNYDRVHYLGYHENVEDLFAESDIFLHYSYLDGMPTVVLEAMLCALPVVANRYNGMVEQVEHGVTGFLVDDLSSLEDVLESLIKNEKKRKAFGERGRSRILKEFTLDFISSCYQKEIEELVKKNES